MALALVAALMLPACAGRQRVREPNRATPQAAKAPRKTAFQPLESRIDAVLGRTLVIPVEVRGPVNGKDQITSRIDDGRAIETSLVWLSVSPDTSITPWLAPAGRWTVTSADADRLPLGQGMWALVSELPLDAVGQGLWVNDRRIALHWLPDPGSLSAGPEAWPLPLGKLERSSSLLRFAAPELASPLRRWRYYLLMAGLMPDARPPAELDLREPMPGLGMVFEDRVLEAIARQTEARWQVALGNLWIANPELAERLKRRLVAAVTFPNGTLAPAWPTSQADLDALLNDLLSPRVPAELHAERAAAWLDSQPPAAAWVIDDAGLRDAMTGRAVSLSAVANLTERATLAWASREEWSGAVGLTTVDALGSVRISLVADESAEAPVRAGTPIPTAKVLLHAGQWQTDRTVIWTRVPARPPGVRLEPMIGDWTMVAWLGGQTDAAMLAGPDWATAALLYRNDAAGTENGSTWMLMVECRTAEGAPLEQESVRVWLGPLGSPTVVLKASASGAVVDERAPDSGLRGEMSAASIAQLNGKWVAQIPVPARAIEHDGTLRVGLERTDSRGRRYAWPRPMLPWQTEPGRAAIDTRAWGELRSTAK